MEVAIKCKDCKYLADVKVGKRWLHRCKLTEVRVGLKTAACTDFKLK